MIEIPKVLSIYRNDKLVFQSAGYIPAGTVQTGDIIHLSTGVWGADDNLNWLPLEVPGVTITGRKPPLPTAEQMVLRAGDALLRNNDFFKDEDH